MLVRKVIVFLTLCVVTHVLLSYWYKHIFLAKSEILSRHRYYEKHRDTITNILAGDSHMLYGLDPQKLRHTTNLGVGGENIIRRYYKLKHYIDSGYKIDTVYMPMDIITYSIGAYKRNKENYLYSDMIDYIELGKLTGDRPGQLKNKIVLNLFPYSDFYNVVDQLEVEQKRKVFQLKSQEKKDEEAHHFLIEYMFENDKDNIFNVHLLNYLDKTLSLLESQKIKTYMIQFPMTEAFYEQQRKFRDMETEINNPAFEILNKYNIEVINGEKLYFGADSLFNDCHHLNEQGKELFSTFVSAYVSKSLVIKH